MPFAFPGQVMPNHPGRRRRKALLSHGYASDTGGGVAPAPTLPDFAYQTETTAFRTAMASSGTAMAARRAYLADKLVRRGKAKGWWSKLKGFYVLVAATEGQAMVNWKSPGTNDLTKTGTPNFVAGVGVTFTTGSFYNTGIPLSAFSQNDAHIAAMTDTVNTTAVSDIGAFNGSAGLALNMATAFAGRCMSTQVTPGGNYGVGFVAMSRLSSSAIDGQRRSCRQA